MKSNEMTRAATKLGEARRSLMVPHPDGEEKSIAQAFQEISQGLHCFNIGDLQDKNVEGWLIKLQQIMDTHGLADPSKIGLYQVKAATLSTRERSELSGVVDQLAQWLKETEGE